MLTLTELHLPDQVRQLAQVPEKLWYQGIQPDMWQGKPCVAIVGSRKVSAYGRQVTEDLASKLARAGVVVISGMALGVDAIAHQAALRSGGYTVAILPGPHDQIYPASHRKLAQDIAASGGLISEYSSGTPIQKHSFIARNRIIAALADVVVIPEAALKSGSLHTARFALELGVTVMAVPGNITNLSSEGTNNLIKSGALTITSVADVFYELGIQSAHATIDTAALESLNPIERQILECLRTRPSDQAELMTATRTNASDLAIALTSLEINGLIRPLGGSIWATV